MEGKKSYKISKRPLYRGEIVLLKRDGQRSWEYHSHQFVKQFVSWS